MLRIAVLVSSLVTTACTAQEKCEPERPIRTPVGSLSKTVCSDSKGNPIRQWLALDGFKLLEAEALYEDERNKNRTTWLYTGKARRETGCPDRLYLIDLNQKPVKVTAFGVKNACNEFHWASWGEHRSVIALKNNVKFTYEAGQMNLPAAGETLWKSIEPPHAGAGLAQEDAVPFAESVPMPK